MLLMAKKVLEKEYVTLFIEMQKLIKKKTRDFDKNKESSCLKYWAVNNMFGLAVS